jgi:hypothetical protein
MACFMTLYYIPLNFFCAGLVNHYEWWTWSNIRDVFYRLLYDGACCETEWRRMVGWYINCKFQLVCKETVVTWMGGGGNPIKPSVRIDGGLVEIWTEYESRTLPLLHPVLWLWHLQGYCPSLPSRKPLITSGNKTALRTRFEVDMSWIERYLPTQMIRILSGEQRGRLEKPLKIKKVVVTIGFWRWCPVTEGTQQSRFSLTWGRKQIQFPKRRVFTVFLLLITRTMDRVRKPNISERK